MVTRTGCTMAPLPAVSHAANRTHFLPVASNGSSMRFLPIGPRSVAEMIWRSVFTPSPQTASTNSIGIDWHLYAPQFSMRMTWACGPVE